MKKILLLLLASIALININGAYANLGKDNIRYYFQGEDQSYYCADKQLKTYASCDNFGYNLSEYDVSKMEDRQSIEEKFHLITLSHSIEVNNEESGWYFWENMPRITATCIDTQGRESKNCSILYIKLDDVYLCELQDLFKCSDIPKYVNIKGGEPYAGSTFPVKPSTGTGTITYNGERLSYNNSKAIIVQSDNYIHQPDGSSITQGTCIINGKQVDCTQVAESAWGFLKIGLWAILGFGVLSLVGFVFWLVMLIHACSNDIPNKVLWIVLLFLFGIIAAIVYYFAVKRHCTTNYIPPANTQPYQASVTVGYQEGPVATTPVVVVAPVPPAPPTTPPVNPITPIITTPVSTMPPTTPPSPAIPTTTQTVESMIATSGAGTMSQAPLGSSSSVTPTVPPPDQNNTPIQNPPSTGV